MHGISAVFAMQNATRDKKGHIAKVCRSKESRNVTRAVEELQPAEHIDTIRVINKVNSVNSSQRHMIDVTIDEKTVQMEVDSGAPCGIASVDTLRKIKPLFSLEKTNRQFVSYTGHCIPYIGRILVKVTIRNTTRELNLFIVESHFDALFGREWISHFVNEINFAKLFSIPERVSAVSTSSPNLTPAQETQLHQLLTKYKDIFSSTAGTLTGPPISTHLKPEAAPVFAKARDIPIVLRDAYAKEIDAKLAFGFLKK